MLRCSLPVFPSAPFFKRFPYLFPNVNFPNTSFLSEAQLHSFDVSGGIIAFPLPVPNRRRGARTRPACDPAQCANPLPGPRHGHREDCSGGNQPGRCQDARLQCGPGYHPRLRFRGHFRNAGEGLAGVSSTGGGRSCCRLVHGMNSLAARCWCLCRVRWCVRRYPVEAP